MTLPVGTKVYYTGDMANAPGNFTVIAHRNGSQYDMIEDDGERTFLGVMHIAETYNGGCGDGFVTLEAWAANRDARIAEMRREMERRNYLSRTA